MVRTDGAITDGTAPRARRAPLEYQPAASAARRVRGVRTCRVLIAVCALVGAAAGWAWFRLDGPSPTVELGLIGVAVDAGLGCILLYVQSIMLRARRNVEDACRDAFAAGDYLARWQYSAAEWAAFWPRESRRLRGSTCRRTFTAAVTCYAAAALIAWWGGYGLDPLGIVALGSLMAVFAALCIGLGDRATTPGRAGPAPEVTVGLLGTRVGDRYVLHWLWQPWLRAVRLEPGPPLVIGLKVGGRVLRLPVPAGTEDAATGAAWKLMARYGI